MSSPIRFAAPASLALVVAVAVSGCGGGSAPSTTAASRATPAAAASVTPDPEALAAYSEAMCPIFEAIVTIDPRIAALRESAAAGDDLGDQTAEMTAIADALLEVLTDLEAVPEWAPGARLRYELIVALHDIRTTLLRALRDPSADGAREDLESLRFIAGAAMDEAMRAASGAGLSCAATS